MTRYHNDNGTRVPFTAAEELARDAAEQAELEAAGDRKRLEAENYRAVVAAAAFDTSLNANWAVKASGGQRMLISTVVAQLEKRARNGQTPVWPSRGVDLEALNKNTGKSITQNVNEAQYDTIINEMSLFDEAWQQAFGSVISEINRLGTDYAAIEAIDVVGYPGSTEQETNDGTAYPWPTHYVS